MPHRSERVSGLIAEGAVVGWVQGCSEFGPRALGNRSIIADPRIAGHKETINGMIKMRESYRPFAPSILQERVRDFFEVPVENADFPFMSFVLNVKPEWRAQLPAITHIDSSARLQTVSKAANPRYWELIEAFGRKKAWRPEDLAGLAVSLPKAAVLLREDRYVSHTGRGFSHALVWNYQPTRRHPLSEGWHRVLQAADGRQSVGQLMAVLEFSEEQQAQAWAELPALWSDRLLVLRPASRLA